MSSVSLVLFIDLKPDTRIDLRVAAKAAIAWANLVEEVGFHFDPLNVPKIELESSQPGSQKLKTIVSAIVGQVHAYLDDPANVARFYNFLTMRQLPASFNAKSLNIVENATTLMTRLQETSRQTIVDMLEEHLNADKVLVIPQLEISAYIRDELQGKSNQTRHLMNGLGWIKTTVKWGGVDHARAIWARPGYTIDAGKVYGPDCEGLPIKDCLERSRFAAEVELIL
jgi:hypothetical protein